MFRLIVLAIALVSGAALACIHTPLAFTGKVSERLKEAFMYHDGALAHLVLRTNLAAEGELPESMAWVIPLPSLPKVMEEVGEGIFRELFALTIPPPPPPPREIAKGLPAPAPVAPVGAPTIKVHAVTIAGDYKLQPIEILSEAAGEELNTWLTANGFGHVPPENQRFYLKKGAVFLAVKVGGLKGATAEIKPLHLAYTAGKPSLPLKFSTHSGVFDLVLYTLTPEKPQADALMAFHLELIHAAEINGADLSALAPDVQHLIGNRTGWLTRFRGTDYNAPGRMVADLRADPAFGIALPVTKTAISGEVLEMALEIAIFALFAGGLYGWMRWKRARNGKPWRLRYAIILVIVGFAGHYLFVVMPAAYGDYTKRAQLSEFLLMVSSVRATIEEHAERKKTLVGAGLGEFTVPEGVSVSRDGAITFEPDPTWLGARLKVTLTPTMTAGRVLWTCEAYPRVSARRFAPQSCRPE